MVLLCVPNFMYKAKVFEMLHSQIKEELNDADNACRKKTHVFA